MRRWNITGIQASRWDITERIILLNTQLNTKSATFLNYAETHISGGQRCLNIWLVICSCRSQRSICWPIIRSDKMSSFPPRSWSLICISGRVLYFLPNSFCSKRFHLILMPSRHPNVLTLLHWQEFFPFAFISIFRLLDNMKQQNIKKNIYIYICFVHWTT